MGIAAAVRPAIDRTGPQGDDGRAAVAHPVGRLDVMAGPDGAGDHADIRLDVLLGVHQDRDPHQIDLLQHLEQFFVQVGERDLASGTTG